MIFHYFFEIFCIFVIFWKSGGVSRVPHTHTPGPPRRPGKTPAGPGKPHMTLRCVRLLFLWCVVAAERAREARVKN